MNERKAPRLALFGDYDWPEGEESHDVHRAAGDDAGRRRGSERASEPRAFSSRFRGQPEKLVAGQFS
jgi:hypothetical protein